MIRIIVFLICISYTYAACSGPNYVLSTSGSPNVMSVGDPQGNYQIMNEADCQAYKNSISNQNGLYFYTTRLTTRPTGCWYYVAGWTKYVYFNSRTDSTTACSNSYSCISKCYEKIGCTNSDANNYDNTADNPDNDSCEFDPDPVVATCTGNPISFSSWCYSFTERDSIGDENTQYMTIQKREGIDCAFTPNNGVLDFSTIDTQGLALYISTRAFRFCKGFTSIVFPDNVDIIIGYYAITYTDLNSLTVTNRMRIMKHGFRSSTELNSLTFESGWNYPLRGFAGTPITSFTVPPDVTEIDSYAFQNANNLETLILNEGLLTIGQSAFTGTKLTSVTIPSTVTSVESGSFTNFDTSVIIDFTISSNSITISSNKYTFTSPVPSCTEIETLYNDGSCSNMDCPTCTCDHSSINCPDLRSLYSSGNCCYDSRTLTAMGV